jgi:membrane protease YdiL (CAAX protease family)
VSDSPRVKPDPAIRGDAQTALLAAYGILAFAAIGRSTYELIFKFDEAPLAYLLSAFAAVVYAVATWAIWRGDRRAIRIGRISCTFEMIGVLTVGAITTINPDALPVGTVWSYFGRDYGWLPLVVPALALWWLYRQHPDV